MVMETPIPKCGRDEEKTTKLDISSFLLVLSSERAAWESAGVERHDAGSKSLTLGQLGLTTGWLAEHGGAVAALDNGGGVGEDGAACQCWSAMITIGRSVSSQVSVLLPCNPRIHADTLPLAASSYRTRHLRDLEASGALDVHEERVGLGDNLLELVGSGLHVGRSVEEVNSESLSVSECYMDYGQWRDR